MGLGHEAHAFGHAGLGREPGDVLAAEAHPAPAQPDQAQDGLHRGGFAGPVGANDHRDLALLHGDGAVMQDVGLAVAAGHALADQKGISHGPLRADPCF